MKKILFIIIAFAWLQELFAQDSISTARPSSIVKLSIGNPIMYFMYPRYGMNYAGIGYEWFRNKKTSFNGYVDYYYIEDGSYNNSESHNDNWQLDNFGTKNIVSLRILYKWYPLHKIKYARGLYVAGGINAAMRYTYKKINDYWGDYSKLDFYAGLGWGVGYRIEVKKRFSFEIFYHRASNGVSLGGLTSLSEYNPIGIDLLDLSIGYVLSKKTKIK